MRATEEHLTLMRQEIIAATNALSAELGEPGSLKPNPAKMS
jgi:IclR family transcriptional regulator, acetate operon repressor